MYDYIKMKIMFPANAVSNDYLRDNHRRLKRVLVKS